MERDCDSTEVSPGVAARCLDSDTAPDGTQETRRQVDGPPRPTTHRTAETSAQHTASTSFLIGFRHPPSIAETGSDHPYIMRSAAPTGDADGCPYRAPVTRVLWSSSTNAFPAGAAISVTSASASSSVSRWSGRERRSERPTERRAGYSRASDAGMPGSSTQGCLCSHHASTLGMTPDLSSSVPAFTARIPAGLTNAE